MTLAFERYSDSAVNIDQYIESMENNRDQFLKNIEQTKVSEEHRKFYSQQPLKVLVITEDWCIDSVQFIPVLVKLARENEDLEIRVIRRDEHKDLAENYKNQQGYQPIPVIIIFDDDGNELGHVLERPEQSSVEMAEETRRFQKANPDLEGIKRTINRMPDATKEKVKEHNRQWRLAHQDHFAGHLLDEIRDIVHSARSGKSSRAAD
jgi:thiol-disulfide isomerase/thioredoxin